MELKLRNPYSVLKEEKGVEWRDAQSFETLQHVVIGVVTFCKDLEKLISEHEEMLAEGTIEPKEIVASLANKTSNLWMSHMVAVDQLAPGTFTDQDYAKITPSAMVLHILKLKEKHE